MFGASAYAAAGPSALLLCVRLGTSTGPRILTCLSQPGFLREMLLLSLAPGSCCGLATGQALAVTPEWPDFCGIRHPRRLLVTGDRFRGSQTPQGAGPQPQQTEGLWVGPESLSLARAGPGGLSSALPSALGSLQSTGSRGQGPEKLPRRQTRVAPHIPRLQREGQLLGVLPLQPLEGNLWAQVTIGGLSCIILRLQRGEAGPGFVVKP